MSERHPPRSRLHLPRTWTPAQAINLEVGGIQLGAGQWLLPRINICSPDPPEHSSSVSSLGLFPELISSYFHRTRRFLTPRCCSSGTGDTLRSRCAHPGIRARDKTCLHLQPWGVRDFCKALLPKVIIFQQASEKTAWK